MTALTIYEVHAVTGGHLPKPVYVEGCVVKGGITFFPLIKAWPCIQKLVLGAHDATKKPLSNTNVFEEIKKKRDAAYNNLFDDRQEVHQDLGLDDPEEAEAKAKKKIKKKKKTIAALMQVPDSFTIDMPQIGNAPPLSFSLIAADVSTIVHVQLSLQVVLYLHQACWHQIRQLSRPKRTAASFSDRPAGIVFCSGISRYRVDFEDEKGRTRAKYVESLPDALDFKTRLDAGESMEVHMGRWSGVDRSSDRSGDRSEGSGDRSGDRETLDHSDADQ